MTPERLQEIETLFQDVLARPFDERTTFIQEACIGDPLMRREIESRVAAHEQAGFVEASVESGAAKIARSGAFTPGGASDRFKVLSELGAGGMGQVYAAEDTKLHRKVAIKVLPRQFTQDPDRVRRFAQEARAASALNHPNIVTIYDLSETDAGYFIVMELIEGRTLRRAAKDSPGIHSVVEWGSQVARALAAAHAAGVIHRDIKSENIMVRDDGFVKVLDFGLARLTSGRLPACDVDGPAQTSPNILIGTAAFMSPEQARGEAVSYSTDIFSLGIVLYQLATGQHPFPGDSLPARLHAIVSITPQRPSRLNREVPATVDALILQMLAKDAALRPTAAEVAERLTGQRVPERQKQLSPTSHRRRWLTAAVVCFAVLCLSGMWLYVRLEARNGSEGPNTNSQAIAFVRLFGTPDYDAATGLSVLSGNVYISGETRGSLGGRSSGRTDAFLRHYTTLGSLGWTRQFSAGFGADTHGWDVVAGMNGSIYVMGFGFEGFLRRYDPTGVQVMTHSFGAKMLPCDVVLNARTPYVVGETDNQAWLRKFDSSAAQAWVRQIGTDSYISAHSVVVHGKAVYVAGYLRGTLPDQTSMGGVDAFVSMYDQDGNLMWTQQFGTSGFDSVVGVLANSAEVYVAGNTSGVFPNETGAGSRDIFVRKYNPGGKLLWSRQFGSPKLDMAEAVGMDPEGIYVLGNTEGALPGHTSAGGTDLFIVKYDAQGALMWTDQRGSSGDDFATRIKVRGDGMYITGHTDGDFLGENNQGSFDAFLLKLRPHEGAKHVNFVTAE